MTTIETKTCSVCKKTKNYNLFEKTRNRCKDCISAYHKEYRKQNPEKKTAQGKKYYEEHKEEHAIWDINYREKNKDILKKQRKIRYENNKDVAAEYQKEYIKDEKVKEKRAKNAKIYRENNKEHLDACAEIYREENKDKILKNKSKYRKERMENDPFFRFRTYISSAVNWCLQSAGGTKNGHSITEYLNVDAIYDHIEKLFSHPDNLTSDNMVWMTWENRGYYSKKSWNDNDPTTWKWQLDHIIPQSELPCKNMDDNNFKKCWALSNLRPLSAKQNLLDGVNRTRHKKDDK
jgi:hypothetical protein